MSAAASRRARFSKHFERHAGLGGFGTQAGLAQHQHGGVDGDGGAGGRDAALRQPGVLPLQHRFDLRREGGLVQLARSAAARGGDTSGRASRGSTTFISGLPMRDLPGRPQSVNVVRRLRDFGKL